MSSVGRIVLVIFTALFMACGAPPTPKGADVLAVDPAKANANPIAITGSNPDEQTTDGDAAVPVLPEDPIRGDKRALVTLVVFSDFQCPFCSRLALGAMERIREEYADDLRIVFKNQPLPFHDKARLAAEVGAGVMATRGSDAFWRFHDIVFRSQKD